MQPLLYLVHRIPYPPDKGDKIRSYHLLKHLLERYQVYVGAFVDNGDDWKFEKPLRQMCAEVFLQHLSPKKSTIKSISGFINNQALTLPYYYQKSMQCWVNDTIAKKNIRKIVVFSSAMAQYIEGDDKKHIKRVIDFVDVDSDKWRQYSKCKSWPMNWLYNRESARLLDFESQIARKCNASLFVSKEEADHFRKLAGTDVKNVDYFCNGVDTEYFSPTQEYENPFQQREKPIVFTGAMDYWANVDAVSWFALEIFPQLYAKDQNARFYIVGGRPAPAVSALAKQRGVCVTGRVPDVRPYLAYANFAVAPMRIARGIQNKVLEAMAMSRRVLVSSAGAEGITADSGKQWLIADSDDEMRKLAEKLLNPEFCNGMGEQARSYVESNYNWRANLCRLDSVLQD